MLYKDCKLEGLTFSNYCEDDAFSDIQKYTEEIRKEEKVSEISTAVQRQLL